MDLTCIRCPMGCAIHVEMENGQVVSVTGNTCPRGAEYAKSEATAPVRTVTSTVRALGGVRPVVAVKTVPDVPKGKIFAVMDAVRALEVKAPVHIGDTITAVATVKELLPERNRAIIETVCTNQDGTVVTCGEATVLPPAHKP